MMDLEGELPELREYGGTSGKRAVSYICDHIHVRRKTDAKTSGVFSFVAKTIKEVFLPQGYPESVSKDYLQYQLWDTLQAFCSSITTMLATLAVLKGVGVGDSSATPLAATLTWMFRDGAGMVTKIIFAWMNGVELDCNAKRWRLVADVLNDVGRFLELLAPYFPNLFLPLVCLATVSTAIVGTAGMATRAALVQHQARRDNMADVSAKDNSQETVVNLTALLVNLWLSSLVANNPTLVWTLFSVFTFLHLLANYRAVSVVCMETFNKNRLHITIVHYLRHGVVLDPTTVNSIEPVIRWSSRKLSYSLGTSITSVVSSSAEYRAAVARQKQGSRIILKYNPSQRNVNIALHLAGSVIEDKMNQLRAAVSVELLDYVISGHPLSTSPILSSFCHDIQQLKDSREELATYLVAEVCPYLMPSLLSSLSESGWDTTHLLLATYEHRYSWANTIIS